MFLLRALACVIMFVAPLLFFAAASLNPHVGLILLIPMIGLVPGLLIAIIVFTPIEVVLRRLRVEALANLFVPLAGGVTAALIIVVLVFQSAQPAAAIERLLADPLGPAIWTAAGVAWGLVWRLSAWLVDRFRSSRPTAV